MTHVLIHDVDHVNINKNKTIISHAATLRVTGWATPEADGVRIGRLLVRTHWRPEGASQRVTVLAYPRTRADGSVAYLGTRPRLIRPACPRQANGTLLTVTGQLIRLDSARGVVRVRVYPTLADVPPFLVTALATREVLRADPSAFHVTLTGQVLPTGHLLAETLAPVPSQVPERWADWAPQRIRLTAKTEMKT